HTANLSYEDARVDIDNVNMVIPPDVEVPGIAVHGCIIPTLRTTHSDRLQNLVARGASCPSRADRPQTSCDDSDCEERAFQKPRETSIAHDVSPTLFDCSDKMKLSILGRSEVCASVGED